MINTCIFDMDGVIIDSEPIHINFEQALFKKFNIEVSKEEHMKFIGTTSYYMWDCLKNKHNLKFTVEDLVKMDRDNYFQFLINECDIKPIEGIPDLIKSLSENNFKLAIASSSPIDVIDIIVQALGIKKYFNTLVTGDYVKNSKPAPDIFLYAAEKLKADPKECVVIEDSHNGILAARNAGMKCVGFINKNSGNQDLSKADIIIENFSEVDLNKFYKL